MPTTVDEMKLAEWKMRLPNNLYVFLDSFFGRCKLYDPMTNWLNYRMDVHIYGKTMKEYRQYRQQLEDTFFDTVGWNPEPSIGTRSVGFKRVYQLRPEYSGPKTSQR